VNTPDSGSVWHRPGPLPGAQRMAGHLPHDGPTGATVACRAMAPGGTVQCSRTTPHGPVSGHLWDMTPDTNERTNS
jgi:hypothetical protein